MNRVVGPPAGGHRELEGCVAWKTHTPAVRSFVSRERGFFVAKQEGREGREGREGSEALPRHVWSAHGEKANVRQGDWPSPGHPASVRGLPGQCSPLTRTCRRPGTLLSVPAALSLQLCPSPQRPPLVPSCRGAAPERGFAIQVGFNDITPA